MTPPDLTLVTSELSPAALATTTRPRLTLFGNLAAWGLGAPARFALCGAGRVPRIVARGARLATPAAAMTEAWTLVWFEDAAGWERWDAPWLVVWQRRPGSIALDDDGLHAEAEVPLGTVALMPLYGLVKPDTRAWKDGLPPAALARCRFWSRALREYPIACDETFRLDGARDAVIVRSRFRFRSIRDDWKTPPLKFAPLPPVLALAHRTRRMPMRLSAPLHDPDLCTAFGPYAGVRGADGYEIAFPVLRYVRETEKEPEPAGDDPTIAAAQARLREAMEGVFSQPDGLFHPDFGDPENFEKPPPQRSDGGNTCWAAVSTQYYCRALPYLPDEIVAKAKPRLRRYVADWLLQPGRFQPFKGKLLLKGPGIGTWGGYDDAGKFSSNLLVTLAAYGRYTGDWDLLRARWPLIQQLFVTPRECTWRGVGRDAIAEMGDEAAPALAMARIAWFVGDRALFAYASYLFVRELVHHVVKDAGAAYFVRRQPLHDAAPIPENVFLTNLWGDVAGWQIDGPTYPKEASDRQYSNRWWRFGDPDVARFHRDYRQDLDRKELDSLLASGAMTVRRTGTLDDPHGLPSIVRLRSLLLNESPAALAALLPVEAKVHSASGVAAHCLAFLRVRRPPGVTELIPRVSTGWLAGIARDRPEDEAALTVTAPWRIGKDGPPAAPALTWYGWKPPRTDGAVPGADRWSFGQIRTDRPVTTATVRRLSWNAQEVAFG